MIVAFDLDGTLVDSAADIAFSANELVTSLGGRSLDLAEVTTLVGDGAGVLVKRAMELSGVRSDVRDALARFLVIYDAHLLDSTVPYPGIRELLPLVARRARLAVLTNKPLEHSIRLLEGLDLREFFDTVIGGDGALAKKPDPEGMRLLMDLVPGEAALLIGDSPVDWETAQAAGCAFAWARYGFGAARFGAEVPDTPYVLDSPRDALSVVDRVAAVHAGY
jgi:phosphoglycolate phosphatase